MSMAKKVKVIALDTDEVLFETTLEEMEKAYEYAAQMEEMGISVKLDAPTIADSLSDTLGLSVDDRYRLERSMEEELHDHEGSCCAKPYTEGSDKLQ